LISAILNFLEWKAIGWSFSPSPSCNNIAPKAKFEAFVFMKKGLEKLGWVNIGVVMKAFFST